MSDDTSQLLIRVKLQGAAATSAELAGTGRAVRTFGEEAKVAGEKTAFASEKAFLFGESMYSLRRYAFWGITAIGATGAGVLKMGYDFDEAKAKSIGALTSLVGGAVAARVEVGKLITLTHRSGLGLSVLATATQDMLNFKFTVRDTNTYLAAFALFSGKLGLGSGGVSSLTSLFDTIQGQGYLNEKNLKAFNAITGLSGNRIIQGALNLNPSQMYALIHGQNVVTASAGLPILGGALSSYAAKQPTPLGMQFDIVRSYLAQITGTLGTPIFDWLDKTLGSLTKKGGWLSRVTAGGQAGGATGMLKAIDPSGTLVNAWKTLSGAISDVSNTLRLAWTIAQPFVGLFFLLASGILSVTSHSKVLSLIFEALTAIYLYHFVSELLVAAKAMKAWAAATVFAETITGVWTVATLLGGVAIGVLTGELTLAAAGMELLNLVMMANPVFVIVGLAAAFYLAYTRVTWFRNAVNETWSWIKTNWPLLLEVLSAPFTFGLSLALTHLQTIWNFLKMLYNWVENHVFKLVFHIPGQGLIGDVLHPERTVERVVGHPLSAVESVAKHVGGVGTAVDYADKIGKAVAKEIKGHQTKVTMQVSGRNLGDAGSKANLKAKARQ